MAGSISRADVDRRVGPSSAAPRDPPPSNRSGSGLLRCERVGDKTVVHTARAHSPLRLLFPKNHGHAQWVFVATLGGGLVDGDALDLRVDVRTGAEVMLGTQASTKAYRAARGTTQTLTARVAQGALLAVLPDPVTCFTGARHAQTNRVTLEGDASLVLIDTMTSGRTGHGERWDFLTYRARTEVTRDGARLVTDAITLDPAHGDLLARLGRIDVLSTVMAFGPRAREIREALLGAHLRPCPGADVLASASALGDDGVLLRLAATRVEAVLHALRDLLRPLATELGDDPFARKW